jgi:HEAT repeat protein
MPNIENWLKLYSSKNLEIKRRAGKELVKREDTPVKILLDIFKNLYTEGLGFPVIKRLSQIKTNFVFKQVIKFTNLENPWKRVGACEILGELGNLKATKELKRLVINDEHKMVRRAALFALGNLKPPSLKNEIYKITKEALKDDINVKMAAEFLIAAFNINVSDRK